MPKKSFLDSIKVADPCSESWEQMSGNDKVRFCSHCSKHVNNISAMTPAEAMRLVRRSGGRLCVRYRTDPKTNSPVFAGRVARFARHGAAASVLSASLLGVGAYAQEPVENPQLVQIERTEKAGGASAKMSGYVTDQHGAAIPYALVTLTNQETMMSHVQNASSEGFYEFTDLESGKYKLRFEAGGFSVKESSDVYLADASEARHDGHLSVAYLSETVEVTAPKDIEHYVNVGVIDVSYLGPRNDLVTAVLEEDLEEVKARIIMGAKINVRDKSRDGMSPLHAAVERGNLEIAEYLLEQGAKANIRDSSKRTPLMMMVEDSATAMLDLLIRFGAKPTLADKQKNTVLHHLAQEYDDEDLVRRLVSQGVDVNAANKEGVTALMVAVENENFVFAKVLLESGADVNARDRQGRTALDRAASTENQTLSLLETYGAVKGGR